MNINFKKTFSYGALLNLSLISMTAHSAVGFTSEELAAHQALNEAQNNVK